MTEHKIFLIGGTDDESGVLRMQERGEDCHLEFTYRQRTIEASAADFFEAFCRIRLELEKEGLIPFCYGASLNVYPSGMGRDMGAGLKAYKMSIGKHAHTQDLVYIFSAGPDVIPAYVSRKREFFEEWLNTPRAAG
ncbi:MAG TPA: hypothetical protein VIW92_04285 [Thermoanaerobaculia bacterium]